MARLSTCRGCGGVRKAGAPCARCGRGARNGSTRSWRDIRQSVIERDRFICQQCDHYVSGGDDTHVDHIVAKADGGTDDMSNLRTLCADCNRAKGDR